VTRFGTLAALGLLLSACASTPAPRLHELSVTAPQSAVPSEISIRVPPVAVPVVVDRPQMVVRRRGELQIDDTNRWAVPLQDGLSEAIGGNLANLLGTGQVSAPENGGRADFSVTVDVQRLESVPGAFAELEAAWTVRRAADGRIFRGRSSVREPVDAGGYAGVAQAHSRAVGRLSEEIAAVIVESRLAHATVEIRR